MSQRVNFLVFFFFFFLPLHHVCVHVCVQVRLVRHTASGKIYAMKLLRKSRLRSEAEVSSSFFLVLFPCSFFLGGPFSLSNVITAKFLRPPISERRGM